MIFDLNPSSVRWPDLDCDIRMEGMLAGAKGLLVYVEKSLASRATAAMREARKTYRSKQFHPTGFVRRLLI
jgi:hypothetical protein